MHPLQNHLKPLEKNDYNTNRKGTGMPKVHRMRAIHIIEAEVQFIAKTFYILKMMRIVDKYDLISDEQYGGRNKHQAQSVLINKQMYYNITHITHIPAAFMDDDARACYDRTLTSLNGLENRRWGVPFNLSEFTTKFIESQVFNIRTAAGESTETYQYSREEQIQGSGQGVAWAGPRWLNSGDTCSRLLRKHCAGMYFFYPNKSLHVRRTGDHFVDDRANGTNLSAMTTDIGLLQQLQLDEQFHFSFYITICNTYKTVYSHIKLLNLDFNQRRPQSIYQQDQSTQPLHHISTIPDYSNFFLLPYHSPAYNLILIH